MRRVTKTHPPQELLEWLEANKELDRSYDALKGTDAFKALKSKLLKEQGFLCAYTGRRVDEDGSHVEHIKPQTKCEGLEDVEYRNVLGCFPEDGGDVSHGYGAPVKGGDWDPELFVSPCSEDCERRFKFTWKGKISAANPEDSGAAYTIGLIKLDHDRLTDMRWKAISGFFGFSGKSTKLTTEEAQELLGKIDLPNSSGHLRAFCFVLKQLLPKFINGQ